MVSKSSINSDNHAPKGWLWGIVAAYLVLAVVYSVATPLGETPDETEHFRYLQHIALTGELPVMVPMYEENVTIEAHQPPLLYLLGARLSRGLGLFLDPADNPPENVCFSFDPDDPGRQHAYFHVPAEWPPQRDLFLAWQLMRWLGVLLGAGTVWLAAQIGRAVAPTDTRVPLVAAALLAFNPQFLHVMASLNNDVLTTFLGAAIVWQSATAVADPRRRRYAGLGLLLGLGLLSKFSLLAFWPLAVMAVFPAQVQALLAVGRGERPLRDRLRALLPTWAAWRRWLPDLLLVLVLPLLVAGWWYVRNWQIYGDPLMWDVTLAAKGLVIAREGSFTLADFGEFLVTHFQSYWLWFGWLTVKAPRWVYGLILAGVLAAVAGLVRWALRRRAARREMAVNGVALLFCGLAVTAVYASLLQYFQTINWTGYQGRLAFAAAAPLAVLLALGLRQWRGAGVLAGGGLLALAVLAVPFLLLPAFPRPQIYQPAPDLTRTCLRFDGGLQVEAVDAPSEVEPGAALPVTVWGYGLQATDRPQPLVVQVRGRDGKVVGEASTSVAWTAGEVFSTTVSVPVAESALPTRGVIAVGTEGADSWQAATSANNRVLDVPLGVETVKIAPAGRPFILDPLAEAAVNAPDPIARPDTAAIFGDQMTLTGYEVTANGIILYWAALAEMDHDYTTFVHVIDAATGELLAQADSQPQRGGYPTGIWDVHEVVADFKPLEWDTLAPSAQVVVGVYLLETGERLPLADGGDALPLFMVGERE